MKSPPLTVLLDGEAAATQQARLGAALSLRGYRVIVGDAPLVAGQIRDQYGARCEETRLRHPLVPLSLARRRARRRVRELGVDVVHINYVRPCHALWSRMEGGPPYVVTAWGSDLNDEALRQSRRWIRAVDHVLHHAAAITADSLPLLEKAKRRCGRPEMPAEIVLWGVDLAAFDRARAAAAAGEWRRRLEIPPGRPVVLSPRQTRPHYHVDRILRAFAASRFAREGFFVIKLYGRSGDEADRKALEAEVDALGIRARVRFAPPCDYPDLPGLYALSSAAVSALEVDGFPSTFCELLALGVPLIATDLPAYRGFLEHGERALLVPPGDHAALVAALDRLADEPELAERLQTRGAAWAHATADWRACVDRFESMYRTALASRA